MIGTGRTAMLLLGRAELTADDVVLVTAAAGGLGALFLQAARNAGAVAYGLASPSKLALVESLGGIGVDYTDPAWPTLVEATPTLLLDGVGAGQPVGRRPSCCRLAAARCLRLVVRRAHVVRRPRPAGARPRAPGRPATVRGRRAGRLGVGRVPAGDPLPARRGGCRPRRPQGRATTGKVVLVPETLVTALASAAGAVARGVCPRNATRRRVPAPGHPPNWRWIDNVRVVNPSPVRHLPLSRAVAVAVGPDLLLVAAAVHLAPALRPVP